jgi:hypothetical protein
LLLDHGHPQAFAYPVWMVFAEAEHVVRRINAHMATQASLLQMALSTIPNMSVKPTGTKSAAKTFADLLKGMWHGK